MTMYDSCTYGIGNIFNKIEEYIFEYYKLFNKLLENLKNIRYENRQMRGTVCGILLNKILGYL